MTDSFDAWSQEVVRHVLNNLGENHGLIIDPDDLLSEDVIRLLADHGKQVVTITNPLELRLAYEQNLRSPLRERNIRYIFVPSFQRDQVPFDILEATKTITLSIKEFIPTLSYSILMQLPPHWIPVIFANKPPSVGNPRPLNDVQTVEYILEKCLNLDFPAKAKLVDWLNLLADMVLYQLELPEVLLKLLRAKVEEHLPDVIQIAAESPIKAREFIQRLWLVYLNGISGSNVQVADQGDSMSVIAAECFSSSRVLQSRMSALLAENLLTPPVISSTTGLPDWVRPSIHYHLDEEISLISRFELIQKQIPPRTAKLADWSKFAWLWADWRVCYYQYGKTIPTIKSTYAEFQNTFEEAFLIWLVEHYQALLAQPYLPVPVMVHRLIHNLASRYRPNERQPLALVIIDGMAMEDWIILHQEWSKLDLSWKIEERSILALVPTITSVSRQAILSGRLPINFTDDWLSTQGEEAAWSLFWEEYGLQPSNIAYLRGLGIKKTDLASIIEGSIIKTLNDSHVAVVALVVNTLDELVHSSMLGSSGLHQQVRLWANQGYLRALVSNLLDRCKTVILTSDHGHIEGVGIGDIPYMNVADERALRARLFSDKKFGTMSIENPSVFQWLGAGLPQNTSVVIPRGIGLFSRSSDTGTSHGGAALEEVVVPLVIITR